MIGGATAPPPFPPLATPLVLWIACASYNAYIYNLHNNYFCHFDNSDAIVDLILIIPANLERLKAAVIIIRPGLRNRGKKLLCTAVYVVTGK